MKRLLFPALLIILIFVGCERKPSHLTVAFYNVENLFDTEDEPGKKDEEFTPEGSKKWDSERYQKKLKDIAHVISAIDSIDLPSLVGLCEVENRKVLEDLVSQAKLAAGNYQIAHFESPDFRGIDVALLYRHDQFRLIRQEAIPIHFKNEPDYKTRDILHVYGKLRSENVHIFVNHWPSRIGGTEKSEPNRIEVAATLKSKINSILRENENANIIVMGDMNDEPFNNSLFNTLSAKAPETNNTLINLMIPLKEANKGSYNYRGNWNMLDNLVVSSTFFDGKGLEVYPNFGYIFNQDWMIYTNKKGEQSPNRTYGGPNYYGGVSDHFPVYFVLTEK